MKDLLTVAEFTMKELITKKSFIISMISILLLIVLAFNIPNILKLVKGENDWNEKILIIDADNIFSNSIETLNSTESGYNFKTTNENLTMEQIKEKIETGDIDSCIKFTKNDDRISLEYIVESYNSSFDTIPSQELQNTFATLYSNMQLLNLNLSEEQLQSLNPNFDVSITQTDENAATGNTFIMMVISIVLFYAIFFCAGQVSTSITTEKTSKIMETLITSTKPRTIVLGKTLGIGVVGILQVISIIVVSVITASFCMDKEMLGTIFDLSNITLKLGIITLVYFILGYALYSLIFALTGSTVNKPEDVNSANQPVNLIAVIGFYLAYFSMMNPSSEINKLSSIIPISSPFSMPLRIMMGTATTGEVITSLLVLLITTIIIAKISIKVYSSAILNYGTKTNIKDILKSR